MKSFALILSPVVLALSVGADEPAIPLPVRAADYQDLLERPPFRQVLGLSPSLVLSGVASLPNGKVVTVWDRATGRSFVVTATPNPQGWKLIDLTQSTDLRSVAATIASTEAGSVTSTDATSAWPPAERISAAVPAALSPRAAPMTTAPRAASVSAIARPMPRDAPVTIAIVPGKSSMQ